MSVESTVGTASAAGTGGTLVGITAGLSGPAANLGGYATAQIVAGSVAPILAGPGLTTSIAVLGGPLVAGGLVIAGVGALGYGICRGISSLFD
jgi:hypothetical protein